MGDKVVSKPFTCRVGLHDWQAAPQPNGRVTIGHNAYVVEAQCSRCGRRKIMSLGASHEQGGPH